MEEDMNKILELKIPLECEFHYMEHTPKPFCPDENEDKKKVMEKTVGINISEIIEILGEDECTPKSKIRVDKVVSDSALRICRSKDMFLGAKSIEKDFTANYKLDQFYDHLWVEDIIKRIRNESNIAESLKLTEHGIQLYKQLLLNKLEQIKGE